MHQSHHIPWHLIDRHFTFSIQSTSIPQRTGLLLRAPPSAIPELKHFVRKFRDTIHMFSTTERQKYAALFETFPNKDFKVFSNDLMTQYPGYLTEENQRIEYWIERAESYTQGYDIGGASVPRQYTTSDSQLADVVKILIHENEMGTLLMLANHPRIPLGNLNRLGGGYHYGFGRLREAAMEVYLFINCMEAVGALWNGKYADSDDYEGILRNWVRSMEYLESQVQQLKFLTGLGERGWGRFGRGYMTFAKSWDVKAQIGGGSEQEGYDGLILPPSMHENPGALKAHVKELFALMYRCDVVMRECGLDPEWERYAVGWRTPFYKVLETTKQWDEVEKRWRFYL